MKWVGAVLLQAAALSQGFSQRYTLTSDQVANCSTIFGHNGHKGRQLEGSRCPLRPLCEKKGEKFVSASRRNQHASRVRSPIRPERSII